MEKRRDIAHFIMRVGISFAFLYPPLAALRDPYSWIGYFPRFIRALPISPSALLLSFGVVEIIIAIWIISGRHIFIPSVLATLMLFGIVIFNIKQFDIVFRDLSIAAATMALAILSLPAHPSLESGKTDKDYI